jgi:hypothetical protein
MQIRIADFINPHEKKLGQKFKGTVVVERLEGNKRT